MIFQDICKIENVTGLKLKLYYYDNKRDFYKDIIINDNMVLFPFDPIISLNQLRYVSEGSWRGGINEVDYIVTHLKYVSGNELMFQIDIDTWNPKIRKIETKLHSVYFEKNEDWMQIKNNSDVAKKIYLKHIAEMI